MLLEAIGKTTVLRTIAGLQKLNSGEIFLKDKLISSNQIHIEPEKRNIALSFQDNSLFPNYKVIDNINFGRKRSNGNGFNYDAEDIIKLKPDGIFLSNGPGDPAATGKYAINIIQKLIKTNIPIFGICLGHQLLALALKAKTKKMKLGHRGANHPVKNLINSKVEITSQNHGFEVVKESLPKNVEMTHKSLFDNSVEGIKLKNKPVFSVQYHPESNPGPQDSHYLFNQFINQVKKNAKKKRY